MTRTVNPVAYSPGGSQTGSVAGSSCSSSDIALPTVLVVGGGVSGLLAAVALMAHGCDVHVFEKQSSPASAEIGFTLTEELQAFLDAYGVQLASVRAEQGRQVLDAAGEPMLEDTTQHSYTTRNELFRALKQRFPKDQYHKAEVLSVENVAQDCVGVLLATGTVVTGHMLVAADGALSEVRQQLIPDGPPLEYAQYVAWRGVVLQSQLSSDAYDVLADRHSLYKDSNTHMVVHPVPSDDGSEALALAWTWFHYAPAEHLPELLVDAAGEEHGMAVAAGRLSHPVATQCVAFARTVLPAPLAELVALSGARMSVSAIADMKPSRILVGRIALLGESGCVVRPHMTASAASKAAADALSLAAALKTASFRVDAALAIWEPRQLRHGLDLCSATMRAGNRLQSLSN